MLNWASRFNIFIFLDSCGYAEPAATEPWMLAAGVTDVYNGDIDGLHGLQRWLDKKTDDWVFGHLNYDVKNEIEPLQSAHPDHIGLADIFFFQPAVVIRLHGTETEIISYQHQPDLIFEEIENTIPVKPPGKQTGLQIQSRLSPEQYIHSVQQLQQHILRGDCYEINFCQEFFSANADIDALYIYQELTSVSPTPFSAFYRNEDKYVLCASPERFLKKTGSKIVSQPIKGTIQRDTKNPTADAALKAALFQSEKDRSENVMVVDLVRNDLSRICREGSVHATELYGIYTFPQVHQMISTVEGELAADVSFTEIIGATFPMGSMTGAPKLRVMQLVEEYEKTKRGIYSGSIGYIAPGGDFDFNVVIRSIMYNATEKYLSYQVGGGITFYSDPQQEYEECLLKASAIKKVLT